MGWINPCDDNGKNDEFCIATVFITIIAFTLIIDYILGVVSGVLNVSHLRNTLPTEFEKTYDADDYARSQSYTRSKTVFGIVKDSFDALITFGFWFSHGFGVLDELLTDTNLHELLVGIMYIGVLATSNAVLELPFSLFSTFVLEEHFGFNKTTLKTFILDRVKVVLLSLVIGTPVLAAILAFFMYAGDFAWLYVWVGSVVLMLLGVFLAPILILPLFLKMTPLEDGELRDAIMQLSQSAKFKMKDIYVVNGSKRSSHSNAFFTGFGSSKRICLFDTLVEGHTVDEIVAVLGHEIGHYKKHHVLIGMGVSVLHTGISLFLLSIFISNADLASAFYVSKPSVYFGFIAFGMLFSPVEMVMGVFMHILSRANEYSADKFSAELIQRPHDLVSCLKKLSKDNLSNLTPHPLTVFLSYSHPPVLKRVNALQQWAINNRIFSVTTPVNVHQPPDPPPEPTATSEMDVLLSG